MLRRQIREIAVPASGSFLFSSGAGVVVPWFDRWILSAEKIEKA